MAAPTIVGVGAAISGIAGVTAPYPVGYTAVTDDVGLVYCECEGADTFVVATGWPLLTQSAVTTGTTSKLSVLWRRLVAGDAAPAIPDAGNHLNARMIVIRGCLATGNPWDVALANTHLTADTAISIPGGTTTVVDCLVLAAAGTGQDVASTAGVTGWANAALTGITERMDDWTASGTGGGFAMATGVKATAGAVGNTTATLGLLANFKTLLSIALKPSLTVPSGYPRLRRTHPNRLR